MPEEEVGVPIQYDSKSTIADKLKKKKQEAWDLKAGRWKDDLMVCALAILPLSMEAGRHRSSAVEPWPFFPVSISTFDNYYGSGSSCAKAKVTVPTVPVPAPVPQHCTERKISF